MLRHNLAGLGAIALVAVFGTACTDTVPTEATLTPGDAHFAHASKGPPDADIGTTLGWLRGKTVTFFYNKAGECITPIEPTQEAQTGMPITIPASDSDCIVGTEAQMPPRGGNDPVLYVLVPLFDFSTGLPGINQPLHCPVAGECINHPSTVDLRPVFGPGTGNVPLPAHSHVIDVQRGGWWEIEVNGVLTPEAWAFIEARKSLAAIREMQAAEMVTPDLDSNMFLFFNVMPRNQGRQGGPFGNN